MRTLAVVVVVVLVGGCVAATAATGASTASPKKGATYEGTLYASAVAALTKKIRLTVDATGKSGRVVWRCGTSRAPISLRFPIKADGSFGVSSKIGGLTEWAFTGTFISPTKAEALLRLLTTCDGKGGRVKLTLVS